MRAEALAETNTMEDAQHGKTGNYCTMCGPDFCSMRISSEL
jgi:thiamine biosynthesis protein ThiC